MSSITRIPSVTQQVRQQPSAVTRVQLRSQVDVSKLREVLVRNGVPPEDALRVAKACGRQVAVYSVSGKAGTLALGLGTAAPAAKAVGILLCALEAEHPSGSISPPSPPGPAEIWAAVGELNRG